MTSLIAELAGASARFRRWWIGELAAVLPRRFRERSPARIEARVGPGAIDLAVIRPPRISATGRLASGLVEPNVFAAALGRLKGKLPVWLLPPEDRVFSRVVQVPRSAVAAFDKLLALEADRWTPFTHAEIVCVWRPIGPPENAKVDVELRFVLRQQLDEWTGELAKASLVPSVLALGAGREFQTRILPDRTAASAGVRRVAALLLAASLPVLIASDWIAARHERDAWQQRAQLERREYGKQRELEAKIEAIEAATKPSGAAGDGIAPLLAALAARLPETDWLNEIGVRAGTVTLRGYSLKPEALLSALEPLARNREVALSGEAALDAKLERQRFSIGFQVREDAK